MTGRDISRMIGYRELLEEPEEEFSWADLVKEYRPGAGLKHAVSNSFAFGGSNACVALSKVK